MVTSICSKNTVCGNKEIVMKKFKSVWVVYIHYKSLFSVFPEMTGWEKFDNKHDADKFYKNTGNKPDVNYVEAPRLYKYYALA
jgi:hypothetical protein